MVISITDCGITNSIIPNYIGIMVLVCVSWATMPSVWCIWSHTFTSTNTLSRSPTSLPALVTIMWVFCSSATDSYVLFHVTIRDIIFFQFGEPINTTGCLVSGRGVR